LGLFGAAVTARGSPPARLILVPLALLDAILVLATASAGPYATSGEFAMTFASLPHQQALAIASLLSGGNEVALPLAGVVDPRFVVLALLAGAALLVSLFEVDPM